MYQDQGSRIHASYMYVSVSRITDTCIIHMCIMDTCIMNTCIMDTCIMDTCIMDTCIMDTCILDTCITNTCSMTKSSRPQARSRTRRDPRLLVFEYCCNFAWQSNVCVYPIYCILLSWKKKKISRASWHDSSCDVKAKYISLYMKSVTSHILNKCVQFDTWTIQTHIG